MGAQLALVTAALVDAAKPQPGMVVLDLASGTGEPALSLARRVAPLGRVTATDFNSSMLSALRENAVEEGIDNIATHIADAQDLPFASRVFDLVTSRFGPMFFADIQRALGEVRRVLRPSGRVALMVWGNPDPGTYFGDSIMPFMRRLPEKPDPDGPGPMRFAAPGKLAGEMERAGLRDVVETRLEIPTRWEGDPQSLLNCIFEIATPLRNGVASLSEEDRRAAFSEVLANLEAKFHGTSIEQIAPVVILTGNNW
jgi:SAM-dependent methyltransferase